MHACCVCRLLEDAKAACHQKPQQGVAFQRADGMQLVLLVAGQDAHGHTDVRESVLSVSVKIAKRRRRGESV
jgi:hypothetical protein